MFVKSIMVSPHKCFVADKDDILTNILRTLSEKDIQAMPVLDGERFIGMISKELLYQACFESNQQKDIFLETTTAGEICGYKDLSIKENEVFERTLPVFKGFPILAVTNDSGQFLGIVTRFDVLEQFESAFGVKRKGVRIAFTSEESAGRIERLGDILKTYHENVISLATFDETDKLARRIVLKVDPNDNIEKFAQKLEKTGFRVLDIHKD
ncbi:CBS domain-containing protein [Thalassobacillus pellis]|uniref:CBS domain-containing protein n=1 Tax=Thalassobacillus pellis TaxID=748008 RepID=UPI00195FB188|nr:CBS domain-containing protein [Thalassobacillus pellis]MBM7552434.1 putative transcriptional regulator [Thalassobacillus pellis]